MKWNRALLVAVAKQSRSKKVVFFLLKLVTLTLFSIEQVSSNASFQRTPYVVGLARDLDNGKIIYRELHFKHTNNVEEVRYMSAENKLIATKFLDYSKSLINPSFSQENHLSNESSQVEWKGSLLDIAFGKLGKKPDKVTLSGFRPDDSRLVIDAGFDHFVRRNWASLLEGRRIQYEFLLTSQLTTFAMSVKKTNCWTDENVSEELGSSTTSLYTCFRTALESPFLRLFTDPIYLKYKTKTKKLNRFKGIGNINNDDGDSYQVDITYTYTH